MTFMPWCKNLDDPHGLCDICKRCDDAFMGSWDAFWRWDDGSQVDGKYYYNIAKARKVAAQYGIDMDFSTNDALEAGRKMKPTAWRATIPGQNQVSVMR